ncbi:MAG: exosortase-associated EpsI family protein [Verrucomicrobia bacterium]|nr:exosortase-associated EpsI family protein [Verrucomicrobiota bacterium]
MIRQKWILALVALALIGATAGALLRLKARQKLGEPGLKVAVLPGTTNRLEILLPVRVRQYTSTNVPPEEIELQTLPKDTTFGRRMYRSPSGHEILLSVVMMGVDRTSIHKPEFCLEAQGWRIIERETTTIPIAAPHAYDLPVRKFVTSLVTSDTAGKPVQYSGVYVFWFVSAERITASHFGRVGYLTWDLLRTGVLPRWAYVSCFAVCPPGQEEATFDRIRNFVAAATPEFQVTTLPAAATAPGPSSAAQ